MNGIHAAFTGASARTPRCAPPAMANPAGALFFCDPQFGHCRRYCRTGFLGRPPRCLSTFKAPSKETQPTAKEIIAEAGFLHGGALSSCRARYANVEIEARPAQRGLWALPAAQRVPPWEWRHGGKQPAQASPEQTGAACGSKRYCNEMVSCEEARRYLSACGGLTRLDSDGDGVPCEALC
jgi:hypothetical protein